MDEKIQYVDKDDLPIGSGTRENAWEKGIHHRLVRVILRDEKSRILIQQRSETKKSYPGRWTDSASGHVDEGETYETAVHREMKEEIGIETDLEFLGKFLLVGHQRGVDVPVFNGVFEGTVASSTEIHFATDEVSQVQWVGIEQLKHRIADDPNMFTPGFIQTIQQFYSA